MRATDARARQILERSESLTAAGFMNLHGAIRDFRFLRQHRKEKGHRALGEVGPQVKFGWSHCPAGHLALLARLMRPVIGCRCSANAVTKLEPSSNSLSLADSGSITELDMPKGRPSRLRKRPVTAGAIVIPIHFDIVVSLPSR